MRADLLDVLLVVNNPMRWESRDRLFLQNVKHMLESGCRITVVELAYGDIPHKYADLQGRNLQHIAVRAKTAPWAKENLLQIGLTRLPSDWKHLAWVDADVIFRHPHWASETVYALQHWEIIQPWSHCYDLGPQGQHIDTHKSFGWVFHNDQAAIGKHGVGYTFAHPGYAWAATRHAMEALGGFTLIQHAICGAGDHHLALALAGKVRASVPGHVTQGYLAPLLELERRAVKHISGAVHYLDGTIEHLWHGNKRDRAYKDRWQIITGNQYDPQTDIKYNVNGVVELAGNKPQLKRDLYRYFAARREDGNVY